MGTKDKKMMKKKKEEEQVVSAATTSSRGGGGGGGKKIITDARFSSVHSDPRFQNVPKQQSKITIDSRFDKMFTDKSFSSNSARIDKRGKAKDQNSENSLPRYYNLENEDKLKKKKSDDEDDTTEEEEIEEEDGIIKLQDVHESDSETTDDDDDLKKKPSDELESDHDTSSTNSDTDDEDDVYSDEEPEEPEENIPLIEQETRRLAIVNMDWSQVRAVDLYVLMSSFLPKTGHVLSVAVYPSDFGLKRMEEEAVRGPVGIFEEKSDEDEDEDEDGDDNDEIDEAKLRAYEKSRLRYYYAVVECDSSATADYLYKTCDGTEFERSSNKLDLRFIPDSMEFKHPPRDVATEAPTKYEGLDFHTRALQHSKIHLTWDEDEPIRAKTLKRKFDADQLAELELKEFLASDDGESDEDGEDVEAADGQSEKKLDKWDKYRALIQAGDGSDEGEDEEDAKDMEVTFNTGLEDISKRILEKKDKDSETVWEAYLRKKSEKKKARKNRSKNSSEDESSDSDREIPEEVDDFFLEEPSGKAGKTGKANRKEKQLEDVEKEQEASRAELELLLADDQDADHNVKGYKIKPKKAKGKKGKEVPSEDKIPVADYNDPRFSALFTSHLFALDPTDPQYKRSAAYARQMAQKHKNGVREERSDAEAQLQAADDTGPKKDEELQSDSISSKKSKHELSSLVRSIKNKSQQVKVLPMQKDPKKLKTARQPITESNNKDDELSSMIQSLKKKSRR